MALTEEWLRDKVPEIREAVRKHRALLYFQDECNVSLTAFLAKTWAPCGKTPKMRVTGKRGGVAALSAINPRGRLLFVLHDKRIASAEVIHFLDQILHYPYFKKLLATESPPASSFRRRVWQLLVRGEELLTEMKKQHSWINGEAHRGTPFPMVVSGPRSPSSPKSA